LNVRFNWSVIMFQLNVCVWRPLEQNTVFKILK